MSPWLELCRAAARDITAALAGMPTRAERGRVVGHGEGGDDTTAVDRAAEEAVLRHFEREDVRVVSEEIGVRGAGRHTVVVDPIDGSMNAKRGVPYFCLSIAVADGDTIGDVVFGFVHDFGSGEQWHAARGGGVFLDGRALDGAPKGEIEMLALEATDASLVGESLVALAPLADRVRVLGAQALSYCQLAAGRVDAVVCLKPARPVDFAAGQLLVRERGLAFELVDRPPLGACPLDLRPRSRVVAAGNAELCRRLGEALTRSA